MTTLSFFNPYAEIRQTKNCLPHWQQNDAVYFVTFRLADSIPEGLRSEWADQREIWLRLHPEPWTAETEREYHERFSGTIERWLDAGYGSCILRRRDCASIVQETLRHFDGRRLVLISSAVLPNHVHALFVQNAEYPLEDLLRSWKTFTARRINLLLGTYRHSLAAGLLRSSCPRWLTFRQLCSLYPAESGKGAFGDVRLRTLRKPAGQAGRIIKEWRLGSRRSLRLYE